MSTTYCTHWCHNCNRPFLLHGWDPVCPYCNGGFIQELRYFLDAHSGDPSRSLQHDEPSHGGGFGIMDTIAAIFRPLMPEQEPTHYVSQPGMGPGPSGSAFVFRGPLPADPHPVHTPYFHGSNPDGWPDYHGPDPVGEPDRDPTYHFVDGRPVTGQHGGDYDLSDMIELSASGRVGPPPAPRAAIDTLPTIRITRQHLDTDANCPVCQDEFELGSEAKKMPCDHIYHSNCIVTWLTQHNSCPVCRYKLTSDGSGSPHSFDRSRRESYELTTDGSGSPHSFDRSRRERRRNNPLSCLWPSTSRH